MGDSREYLYSEERHAAIVDQLRRRGWSREDAIEEADILTNPPHTKCPHCGSPVLKGCSCGVCDPLRPLK